MEHLLTPSLRKFQAVTSNSLLFFQILIAASLTVLGAFNDRRARTVSTLEIYIHGLLTKRPGSANQFATITDSGFQASIFLGATNTVIAGLLTYFKSRNQPNRARQFRNELGRVKDALDDAEADFRTPGNREDVHTIMQQIRTSYYAARSDAEANYPDLWVKATGTPYNPFWAPRTPNDPTGGYSPGGQQRPGQPQPQQPSQQTPPLPPQPQPQA